MSTKYLKYMLHYPVTLTTGRTDTVGITISCKPDSIIAYNYMVIEDKENSNYNKDIWDYYVANRYFSLIEIADPPIIPPPAPPTRQLFISYQPAAANNKSIMFNTVGKNTGLNANTAVYTWDGTSGISDMTTLPTSFDIPAADPPIDLVGSQYNQSGIQVSDNFIYIWTFFSFQYTMWKTPIGNPGIWTVVTDSATLEILIGKTQLDTSIGTLVDRNDNIFITLAASTSPNPSAYYVVKCINTVWSFTALPSEPEASNNWSSIYFAGVDRTLPTVGFRLNSYQISFMIFDLLGGETSINLDGTNDGVTIGNGHPFTLVNPTNNIYWVYAPGITIYPSIDNGVTFKYLPETGAQLFDVINDPQGGTTGPGWPLGSHLVTSSNELLMITSSGVVEYNGTDVKFGYAAWDGKLDGVPLIDMPNTNHGQDTSKEHNDRLDLLDNGDILYSNVTKYAPPLG